MDNFQCGFIQNDTRLTIDRKANVCKKHQKALTVRHKNLRNMCIFYGFVF